MLNKEIDGKIILNWNYNSNNAGDDLMKIYTIGHSVYDPKDFINLLRKFDINCIVDVRSTPYSKFNPTFNLENIKRMLIEAGIYYISMGKELGARRDDKSLYHKSGYLDFEKVRKDKLFHQGIDRVKDGISRDYKIALMCTEKDPFDCHRCILVAKEFYDQGYEVKNILPNGDILTQEQIEEKLIEKYFPNRFQLTIDSILGNNLSEKEMIAEAYKRRNAEIGYRIDSNEEE